MKLGYKVKINILSDKLSHFTLIWDKPTKRHIYIITSKTTQNRQDNILFRKIESAEQNSNKYV